MNVQTMYCITNECPIQCYADVMDGGGGGGLTLRPTGEHFITFQMCLFSIKELCGTALRS